MELYRADLKADLESIRPYLKEDYVSILDTAYNAEILETLISYGFMGSKPVKEVIKELLDFKEMGEVFEHEA
jgi:hypothetical protein